jgi:hypothetical protein
MASFHCSVKSGKSGTGGEHADYIEREGKYATKEKDDLEHRESGNLPEWAENSRDFWHTADANERANGAVYREFEIALPRELTKAQRLELVHEFIAQEIGDKHAYTFAIHNPKAALDDDEQPHAHIMYSERTLDGIARPADQYFKRWNAKKPEAGGCKKATATAKTPTERKAELVQLRERFAQLQNKHLARHGHSAQVTHLSLKSQGIDRKPEPHFGPKLAKMLAKDIREVRAVPVQAQQQDRQNFVEQAKERARAQVSQMREAQAAQLAAAKAQLAEQQAAQARAEILAQVAREKEAARQEASRPKPAPDRGQGYSR